MKNYSSFFETLHDGIFPDGYLGQDTHYCVLRNNVKDSSNFQNFAIVWGEDCDKLIKIVEKLYSENLIYPILFIGKRNGNFAIIIDKKVVVHIGVRWMRTYESQVKKMIKKLNRSWTSYVALIDNDPVQRGNDIFIEYEFGWSFEYLKDLKKLWDLGIHAPGWMLPPINRKIND